MPSHCPTQWPTASFDGFATQPWLTTWPESNFLFRCYRNPMNGTGIHCARCGIALEDYLTAAGRKPECALGLTHDFGDWKKLALPVSLFREAPLTLACVVGFLPLAASYDHPLHAAVAALAAAAATYAVMRTWFPPLQIRSKD